MDSKSRPKIICVMPIRNEAWILERSLACASVWADHIIVADQGSDDGSAEIARSFPKVTVLDNPRTVFDESERQTLLINAAREIPGPRLIIALDADEALTANFEKSPEWASVLNAYPGTVIRIDIANLWPDLGRCWIWKSFGIGLVDDGSDHHGSRIHSHRLPFDSKSPSLVLHDIKVLHYSLVDLTRTASKRRWYQCFERLENPTHRASLNYRRYYDTVSVPRMALTPVPDKWFRGYLDREIDMTSFSRPERYWWDEDLVDLLKTHGPNTFRRESIWDVDWYQVAQGLGITWAASTLDDPRSPVDKLVQHWLRYSQPWAQSLFVRAVDRALTPLGY